MIARESDWYKNGWGLGIKNQSWVEDTPNQVNFIIKSIGLKGNEKILDLACGYGRHSLELARRGFDVTGIDITKVYINDATSEASKQHLKAHFIQADIREVTFDNEFDVVLNMADGAIGYLENDVENLKIFDVVSKALKPGGKHFMDIMNGEYANAHYPAQLWDAGKQGLTLSKFEWNKQSKILLYGQHDYLYNSPITKPEFITGDPTRLYDINEIRQIMNQRGMKVLGCYAEFDEDTPSESELQLRVISQKCSPY